MAAAARTPRARRRTTGDGARAGRTAARGAKGARQAAPQVQIHHGDCLDVLPRLEPRQFHFCCIDPPFNTGAIHRVLRDDGTVLVHCDWRASHRIRVLLDEVFGERRFLNHLVWQYGLGGSSPRMFARKHDDLLWYAKGKAWWFNAPRVPATSQRLKGQTKKATDVLEVPSINNMAKERVGWPTQKPLALLELLVGACCPPGGAVLDCFCGSGTTLVAAARLGRSAVGVDADARAIELARGRLRAN
jgi:site-specific DNA-methyltransferase (adenine-specific)